MRRTRGGFRPTGWRAWDGAPALEGHRQRRACRFPAGQGAGPLSTRLFDYDAETGLKTWHIYDEVTGETARRLEHAYRFDRRGMVDIKGKGSIETWFLIGHL